MPIVWFTFSFPAFVTFLFRAKATPAISTLSLHDALPISAGDALPRAREVLHARTGGGALPPRSEEHTSELQSLTNLVCRLLLEKKNKAVDAIDRLPQGIT